MATVKPNKSFVLVVLSALIFMTMLSPAEARYIRRRNLHHLVKDNKPLVVYLGEFRSKTDTVDPEILKAELSGFIRQRGAENLTLTEDKKSSDIVITCEILNYVYLEEDPIDNFVGGTTALIVDALIKQNYARLDVEFSVFRTKDDKRLWRRKYFSTVTESNMPIEESMPKVFLEACKRFVFLCFGKPK